jgi:hypothetical protein
MFDVSDVVADTKGALGSPAATSAPGLGSPLPHLHRDWERPCHICSGQGDASAEDIAAAEPRGPARNGASSSASRNYKSR